MTFRPYQVLTAILAAAFLLSGCQANSPQPTITLHPTLALQTPPAVTASAPEATPTHAATAAPSLPDAASLKGKTILFWHPWSGELAKQAGEAVAAFNKENTWGIQVQAQSMYSAGALYDAVAGARDQAQKLPQVVAATSDQLAEWSVNGDRIVDLNGYIQQPQNGMDAAEVQGFQPIFWKQDQAGPRQLGLPALRSAQVLFYNQTWAKELGFQTPPQTPEAFREQACAAAKHNNSLGDANMAGTGGWLVDNDALTTLSWMSAFGAKAVPDTEGQPYTFESKAGEQAVAFLRKLYDDGCAWTGRSPMPFSYFTQRMALFYSASSSNIFTQASYQTQQNSKDQWTLLPFPGEDGKALVYASGYSYALFKTDDAQAQLAGWLFIRWLEQPDVAVKLARALPSIPVSAGVGQQISDRNASPWTAILPLADAVRPAPALSTWRAARRLFEDAAWQIYRLPAEGLDQTLPQTLPQLDAAVKDALKKTP